VSIHKSLKVGAGMVRARNVYNRWERLQKLKEQGAWKEGDKIFGLPKVRTSVVKIGGKKKKAPPKAEGAEGAKPAEGAAKAAAPAADKKK
jgi:small basic protein (TIGR04137 family)